MPDAAVSLDTRSSSCASTPSGCSSTSSCPATRATWSRRSGGTGSRSGRSSRRRSPSRPAGSRRSRPACRGRSAIPATATGSRACQWPAGLTRLGAAALRQAMPLRAPLLLRMARANTLSLHHSLCSRAVVRARALAWRAGARMDGERLRHGAPAGGSGRRRDHLGRSGDGASHPGYTAPRSEAPARRRIVRDRAGGRGGIFRARDRRHHDLDVVDDDADDDGCRRRRPRSRTTADDDHGAVTDARSRPAVRVAGVESRRPDSRRGGVGGPGRVRDAATGRRRPQQARCSIREVYALRVHPARPSRRRGVAAPGHERPARRRGTRCAAPRLGRQVAAPLRAPGRRREPDVPRRAARDQEGSRRQAARTRHGHPPDRRRARRRTPACRCAFAPRASRRWSPRRRSRM